MELAMKTLKSDSSSSYNGRITAFVLLSCMVASTGGLLFGYDIGISGGVTSMEPFLKKFFPEVQARMAEKSRPSNYCKFDSQLLTAFTSSLYLAGLVASLFASSVTRAFGRRSSMLIGGAVFLAGSAMGGAAINVFMLILGRVLLGIGIGFTNQSVPLYISEISPPNYRGAMNNAFEICVGFGVLFSNLINYGTEKIEGGWGWRLSLALAAVPSCILLVGAFFLSDTPNSILQRHGDADKAAAVLQKLRGTTDVRNELDDIVSATTAATATSRPFREILRRKYRPQLVIALVIPLFHIMNGISMISFYAPILFRSLGFKEGASLMSTAVTRMVATCCNLAFTFLVDRVGRRAMFLVGGVLMVVSEVIIACILATQLKEHGEMSRAYAFVVLVLVCVVIAGFALSWAPLSWLVTSEIFSLEIRSTGQSIMVAGSFLMIFLAAQLLLAMLCRLKSGVFFLFAGFVFVMTAFMIVFMPETKNVPMEKIDGLWREHWFWKRMLVEDNHDERDKDEALDVRT